MIICHGTRSPSGHADVSFDNSKLFHPNVWETGLASWDKTASIAVEFAEFPVSFGRIKATGKSAAFFPRFFSLGAIRSVRTNLGEVSDRLRGRSNGIASEIHECSFRELREALDNLSSEIADWMCTSFRRLEEFILKNLIAFVRRVNE